MILKGIDVKNIRLSKGLNQTEFGQTLGVSLRTVQSWESKEEDLSKKIQLLINNKYAEITHQRLIKKEITNEKENKVPY